jgi:hypothetical protein
MAYNRRDWKIVAIAVVCLLVNIIGLVATFGAGLSYHDQVGVTILALGAALMTMTPGFDVFVYLVKARRR